MTCSILQCVTCSILQCVTCMYRYDMESLQYVICMSGDDKQSLRACRKHICCSLLQSVVGIYLLQSLAICDSHLSISHAVSPDMSMADTHTCMCMADTHTSMSLGTCMSHLSHLSLCLLAHVCLTCHIYLYVSWHMYVSPVTSIYVSPVTSISGVT